jgi:hypothetical protein
MERSRPQPWILLLSLLMGSAALACPNCATSRVVRASILDERFWSHLAMAIVPFLLIGALSALLYRVGLPQRETAPARDGQESRANT